MGKSAFEGMLERECYDKLYKEMTSFIEDNCNCLELEGKSNIIEEVQVASLEDMEIKKVSNINQKGETLTFDIVTSCEIEIEETVRRNREVDGVNQWFLASCRADFDGELRNFTVKSIDLYNR